ncbi:tripartite tricarboxylate transporter TctB family protein [Ideonella sp.]|uniref:tripartite tricarboxylate transporter TctB family protein n=1 Tax=Ideonella sp. TaxID=1929293 RepID=UPI0035AEA720
MKAPQAAPQMALGAGTLLAGIGFVWGAFQLSSDAGYAGVGPNFLPLVVGAMLCVCGVWLVWEAASGGFRNMEEPSGADRGDWRGFAWVSAGILANAALITTIGFILSCTLCFVLAARGFKEAEGERGIRLRALALDALVGLAISAPVFWMFTQLLSIGLPGLTSTGWL